MNKRKYINKKKSDRNIKHFFNKMFISNLFLFFTSKRFVSTSLLIFTITSVCTLALLHKSSAKIVAVGDLSIENVINNPVATTASKRIVLSVPKGVVKKDPFVPYRDISGQELVNDVPTDILVPPPDVVNENSDAARVMDTMVSGILYDKFSPSAILNIEGNDYLVKKGDTVNNYKIIDIVQDSVTVCLGANIYKAGIGEILTEGTINKNNISNLNNKFGGNE